ncbi:hypothetical protein Micbo1qcDRAFT_176070 [Microdochium bolleyi]|uniref:Uncharacterized protein n=1 Tax=Microdochium bolleyi TaxID=196109 RepID=A0A136J268_9PEZI|nr:hypothetical protein Micbo1qcDRAFT_176070 [Microdochium bolleyi]
MVATSASVKGPMATPSKTPIHFIATVDDAYPQIGPRHGEERAISVRHMTERPRELRKSTGVTKTYLNMRPGGFQGLDLQDKARNDRGDGVTLFAQIIPQAWAWPGQSEREQGLAVAHFPMPGPVQIPEQWYLDSKGAPTQNGYKYLYQA